MSPDKTPGIYGPIQSEFSRVRFMPLPRRLTPHEENISFHGAIFPMHLGVETTTDPKILPALAVVRKAFARHEKGEAVSTEDVGRELEAGGHLRNNRIYWRSQRDSLLTIYALDRPIIDRALDFAAAEQTPDSVQ